MEPKLSVDVSHLSETERQTIYGVLKRDEDLRKRDEQRINRLKSELQYLRRRGAIRGGSDPLTSCGRCRNELGKIINRGAPCVLCRSKICKMCRVYAKDGSQWICVVCHKQLELEAATGEWMNEFVRRASRKRDKRGFVPPSDIVKELIVRSQSESGHHGCQEKERQRRGPVLAVTTRQRSAGYMEPRSPAVRRKNSLIDPPPDSSSSMGASAAQKALEEEDEVSSPEASPRRSSETPVPAPRQKSPLLKQRAVLVESDSVEQQQQRVPTPVKRQAPPPPLIQHPSDRSDSGIGADVGGRSPKTSQSSSAPSRQSSSNSSGQGPWNNNSAPAESQDSGSDLSDSEVEPSTGVVFRKVTLKRRKRRDVGGVPKTHGNSNDARRPRFDAAWEDSCCPPAIVPPWNTFSLPRFPSHHSRSSPVPQPQQLAWDGSCDQLTRTNSSNSLWWDAATCRGGSAGVWLADVDGLGLAPGLSRSLGAVTSDLGANGWSAAETPFLKRRNSARFEWKRSSTRVKQRRRHCRHRLSASYEDLRISSPEYEEDFPLDLLRNADSYSDILGHVTDKIVPEGEEYRIVFISSSSSKSSGLNDEASTGDDSVQLMDDDAEWDRDSVPSSPPPLPLVPPPPSKHQSGAVVDDDDIFAYFRGFADAEWKETSLIVAEEESDGEERPKRPPTEEDTSPILRPYAFTRTNSSRSSGERSIGEQSFFNHIFRDQTSPEATLASSAMTEVQPADAEEEKSSSDDDPEAAVDSSDDECAFGSYDVNVSFSEEELEAAAPAEGDEALPSDGYLTESESIVDFVLLSEEETDGGEEEEEEEEAAASFLDGLAIPDVQHDSIRRLLDDVEAAVHQNALETRDTVIGNCGSDEIESSDEQSDNGVSGKAVVDGGLEDEEEMEAAFVAGSEAKTTYSGAEAFVGAIADEWHRTNDEDSPVRPSDASCPELEPEGTENSLTGQEVTYEEVSAERVAKEADSGDLVMESADGETTMADHLSPVVQELPGSEEENEEKIMIDTSVLESLQELEDTALSSVCLRELENTDELVKDEKEEENEEIMMTKMSVPEEGSVNDQSEDHPELPGSDPAPSSDLEDTKEFVKVEEENERQMMTETSIPEEPSADESIPVSSVPQPTIRDQPEDHQKGETLSLGKYGEATAMSGEELAKSASEDGVSILETVEEATELVPENDIATVDPETMYVEEAAEPPDEDPHGETSSDGEKLESDTDSLDTVIEGESFRRMRQMAIRQKLLEVNSEFDGEQEEEQKPLEEVSSLTSENPNAENKPVSSKPNLQELVAQSRALTASFKNNQEAAGGADHDGSVLEKYFVSSLEHMAPPVFNRGRSRHHMAVPKIDVSAASPSPTLSGDEIVIESYQACSEDEEFTDSCSEDNFNGPIVSGDEDSETTFDEDSETTFDEDDEDTSSTASTSSDEGSACLRITPRQCAPMVAAATDEAWYRLDMSLHTIMEESCEESESERERHLEDRKRAKSRDDCGDRSQLERYFHFTFDVPAMEESAPDEPAPEESTDGPKIKSNDQKPKFLASSRLSLDGSEFSDDAFSETESSVFSESNNRDGAEVDDEELARLASSRLEKYFLTGLLELQVGYPEEGDQEEEEAEAVITPTPEAVQTYTFAKKSEEVEAPPKKLADKVEVSPPPAQKPAELSSSKEETDEDIPFEKNDGCDTIKRKKKSNLELEDEDVAAAVVAPVPVVDEQIAEQFGIAHTELTKVSVEAVQEETSSSDSAAKASLDTLELETEASTKEANQISAVGPVVTVAGVSEKDPCEKVAKEDKKPKDTLNGLNLVLPKEPLRSLPVDILDPELNSSIIDIQLLSWDPSYYGEATNPGLVGRGLTLDWKQQSRDSGFIGSSDDLLQDTAGDDAKEAAMVPPTEAVVATAAVLPPQQQQPQQQQQPSSNLFGLFRSSSTRSNFCAASTTSDDEAQYIVNQLVGHIAKSMSRSPQLARAKPPEIEVFETELTKLMQTVPGIDATVKEIVEELSSTDYCSDSYESSDYTGSDQEAPVAELITKQALYNLQLRRNDSWRSIASTASKGSSVGAAEDAGQKLPEETMYIYQRFMDSLAKMTEQASEEAKTGDGGSGTVASATNASAATSRGGSPPTPVKMLHHIRSKLTSLMREVHADRSPLLGGVGESPRRTIAWSKPSSGSGSAAGDELSLSSTSSANFDSEDSPTDTELSMDSTDEPSVAALEQAHARIRVVVATSPPPRNSPLERGSGDGLERWSSDMTIVDDDLRYSSVHKSEPILSMPESTTVEDQRSNSRELGILSKTLPSSKMLHPGNSSAPPASTQRPRSIGSLTHLMATSRSQQQQQQCQSSKSEWEVWRDNDCDVSSKTGSVASPPSAPYKHKSCDGLTSARSKSELRASAAATSRDRKKHGFAFMMMRQKSGSSASLRDGTATPEGKSIKQQIQFRSQLHLKTGKEDAEETPMPQHQQQQQQQSRSSSLQRLFGKDLEEQPQQYHHQQQSRSSSLQRLFGKTSKKGLGSVPSVTSCWSSPDVGVDVTTAAGVDLSDSEGSSGGGKVSANIPYGNVTSIYVPSGAYSTQDLSAAANPRAKASTLPRAASSDLHANVSFLHNPPARRNLTCSTNTLPHSYTLLVPQQEAIAKTTPQRQQSTSRTTAAAAATTTTTVTSLGVKSVVQVVPPESPKARREIQSWPVTDGTGDVSKSEMTLVSVSGQSMAPRAKSLSPPAVTLKYGSHVPSIQVAECPERTGLRGSGASSHTGSSDPDSMTEEDIDRLVALHKNRSLSSLGVCSESMSSVYSAAGGGHYGTVTVRGEVQFGLSYNYVSGALEVHIKQCRDLAPVDAKRNRSDPYVKVYLLPDKSKSGKRKTRVKKHTLNPLFNEILKFHVTISELETRTLWMTVWHSDMFGRNEFLGEVTLPMGYEAWDDTSPKWYILQERLGPPEEVYSYKGDLVLSLKFVPPDVTMQKKGRHSRGSLHVLVKEARNLMAVCTNGTSDPFCKCYLLPDKGKSNKQKTPVVKRSCNPKWNHTFVYDDISLDQLRERCLELTVWDYDRLTSNDFLGGVRLSLGTGRHQGKKVDWIDSRTEEIAMWQAMLENPNIWVDATILLRPTMDHRQTSTW